MATKEYGDTPRRPAKTKKMSAGSKKRKKKSLVQIAKDGGWGKDSK